MNGKGNLTSTQKLTFSAMLLALSVASTLLAKTIAAALPLGDFAFVRFSFTPALVIYTSITMGPLYGIVVGVASDLLPAFIYPTGAVNFFVTIVYAILGFLPWVLEKLSRHFRASLRKPYYLYGALAGLLVLMACLFYATDLFDSSFGPSAGWAKPTILGVLALFDVGLGIGLYFSNRYYQKQLLEIADVPSPNEVALIAFILEVVVMVALKALAFYGYFSWIANKPFMSYGLIFSILLLATPVDVVLITFIVSWMLIYTKRFIRSYGFANANDKNGNISVEKTSLKSEEEDEKSLDEIADQQAERKTRIAWIIFFSVILIAMVVSYIVIKVIQG